MNILFVIKNTANLRTLAPVVRLLAERGHEVRIACRDVKSRGVAARRCQELVAGSARITVVEHPFVRQSGWSDLAGPLRRTIDYLRYLEPVYRDVAEAACAGRVGGASGRSAARRRGAAGSGRPARRRGASCRASSGASTRRRGRLAFLAERAPRRAADHAADRLRHLPGRPRARREAARDPRLRSRCAAGTT